MTNIYAPYTPYGKLEFLSWFKNIAMPDEQSWIIKGDFNFENKNRLGGDINMMMAFNEAINKLV
jgi:hypothetical protein